MAACISTCTTPSARLTLTWSEVAERYDIPPPLKKLLKASNDEECRQIATDVFNTKWGRLGLDDRPFLWALICAMNNVKKFNLAPVEASRTVAANHPNGKYPPSWTPCLFFNYGPGQCSKDEHGGKFHYCLLCRSPQHSLEKWDLTEQDPTECTCPLWKKISDAFHELCRKLRLPPYEVVKLFRPLIDSPKQHRVSPPPVPPKHKDPTKLVVQEKQEAPTTTPVTSKKAHRALNLVSFEHLPAAAPTMPLNNDDALQHVGLALGEGVSEIKATAGGGHSHRTLSWNTISEKYVKKDLSAVLIACNTETVRTKASEIISSWRETNLDVSKLYLWAILAAANSQNTTSAWRCDRPDLPDGRFNVPCLYFNHFGASGCNKTAQRENHAPMFHHCLLCHSPRHGLRGFDLTQPLDGSSPFECRVWQTITADFEELCRKLQLDASEVIKIFRLDERAPPRDLHVKKRVKSSKVQVPTGGFVATATPKPANNQEPCSNPRTTKPSFPTIEEDYEQRVHEKVAAKLKRDHQQQLELQQEQHELDKEAALALKHRLQEQEKAETAAQIEKLMKELATLKKKQEEDSSEATKEKEAAQEEKKRLELLMFIKDTVSALMIKNGAKQQGDGMKLEYNEYIDKTPVFTSFVKALLHHRSSNTTAPSASIDVLDLLKQCDFHLGYHGTRERAAVVSIMTDGFDPRKRGVNGQAHGRGEYLDIDLSHAPTYSSSFDTRLYGPAAGGIVGCLVLNAPSRVTTPSHNRATILVVDNPLDAATEGSLCLPIFVLGGNAGSIAQEVMANSAHHKSHVTTNATALDFSQLPSAATNDSTFGVEFRDDHGRWQPMDPVIAAHIEDRLGIGARTTNVRIGSFQYSIDLENETQTNMTTGRIRPLRFIVLPSQ